MSIDKLIERLERSRTDFWAHTRMDCLREAADALASTQEEMLRLNKDLMFANAQLADMEFLSVEGFISWKQDRAARSLHDGEGK